MTSPFSANPQFRGWIAVAPYGGAQ